MLLAGIAIHRVDPLRVDDLVDEVLKIRIARCVSECGDPNLLYKLVSFDTRLEIERSATM